MSKLPSKNAFIVPVSSVAAAVENQKTLEQTIYETIEQFIQTRSFRRISIIAGAGSVVIAAWYIIRKISSSGQSVPVSSPPLPVEEIMAATVHQDHDHLVEAPPEDEKVVIHCCPRGYYTPCIATAPLHLETFLRVANIPYEVRFCSSANGHLTPFLTLGNKSADEFRGCLRILAEKFDIDLEKDASASRKTASHLIDIMLENHFSWGILIWRWIYDEGDSLKKIQPISSVGEEVVGDVAGQIKEATRFQPISRLSKEEFVDTLFQGLQDISAALGKHSFFMGQNPGVVDCNAFAVLAQMMWNMPDSPFEKQIRRYSNLVDFVTRMRDIYWPDWNQLIDKPEEYEALSMHDETVSRQASEERLKRKRSSRSRNRDSSQGCKVERILTPEDTEELRKRKLVDSPTVKSQIEKETEYSNNSEAGPLEKTAEGSKTKPVEGKKEESESQRKEKVAPPPESNNLTNLGDASAANTNSNANVQPVGILKSGNAPDIIKQRSGIVNGTGANANLTSQEITPNSDPKVSNQKQQPQPSQQVKQQQPPQQIRQQLQAPAQRKSSPNTPQQAEPKPQSQSQPINKDSVFQVHKNSVKFADNATASVVFAMDEKAVKNIPEEDTKNSPSYTISTNESPSKKPTEIPVRTPNPEPAKKTIAVMLHDKQFPAKKGPVPQTQERAENNPPKKPEATSVDISQLRQQHYQQHLSNMNQTQQQQKQVPPQPPSQQQQQYQPPRQQQSSPPNAQQQQSAPQHPQQQTTPNQMMQQPPRRDTERAQSANAVNNNGIMSGPPQRPGNNYETYEMNGSLQMRENGQHMDADGNSQYYAQRPQPMQQGFRPPYGRPAIYAQSHGAVFPPHHQIRYGPPMTPPGMGMYSHVPLEEYQKAQQAEAYYRDYHYPTGMHPASYMVADQMTPTMLQRFY